MEAIKTFRPAAPVLPVGVPLGLGSFPEALAEASDPFAAFAGFLAAQGGRGFAYLRLLRRGRSPLTLPRDGCFRRHSFPAQWESAIAATPLIAHDPTVRLLCGEETSISWQQDELAQAAAAPSLEQRRHRWIANDLGLVSGVSMRLSARWGGISAIGIWCETQANAPSFARYWSEVGPALTMAAQLLDRELRDRRPNALVGLTPRETECVDGLVQGMRPAEICWKLGISERTFEKHISSAKAKLRARTRDQAVANAVLLRLLPEQR